MTMIDFGTTRPSGHGAARPARSRAATALVVFAIAAAVCGAGVGIDLARSCIIEARLGRALDAAALAGGRVHVDEQRDGHVRTFFRESFPDGFLGAEPAPLTIAEDRAAGTLVVGTTARVHTLFRGLIGFDDLTVEARSVVRRNRGSEPVLTANAL